MYGQPTVSPPSSPPRTLILPLLSLPHPHHTTALPHPRLPRPLRHLTIPTLQVVGGGARHNTPPLLLLLSLPPRLPTSQPRRSLGRTVGPANRPLHAHTPPSHRRKLRIAVVLLRRPSPGIRGGRSLLPTRGLQSRICLAHRCYLTGGRLVFHLCLGRGFDDGPKSTAGEARARSQSAPRADGGPAADQGRVNGKKRDWGRKGKCKTRNAQLKKVNKVQTRGATP